MLSAAYAAASERPVLQVFTGKDGLHRIMDDVLIQTSDEILLFSNFDEEKKVSRVNEALCKGCGVCVASCPSGAITGRHFTDKQIIAEIEGILA